MEAEFVVIDKTEDYKQTHLDAQERAIRYFIAESFKKVNINDYPANEWEVKCPEELMPGLINSIVTHDLAEIIEQDGDVSSFHDDYEYKMLDKAAKHCHRAKSDLITNVYVSIYRQTRLLVNEFYLAVSWEEKKK